MNTKIMQIIQRANESAHRVVTRRMQFDVLMRDYAVLAISGTELDKASSQKFAELRNRMHEELDLLLDVVTAAGIAGHNVTKAMAEDEE